MNFLKFPLGDQDDTAVAEVLMQGVESDVFLVDPPNLASFESGRAFTYVGGHYKSSPVRLQVPRRANWTAVVVPGPGGTVRASVRVLSNR